MAQLRAVGKGPGSRQSQAAPGDYNPAEGDTATAAQQLSIERQVARMMAKGSSREAATAAARVTVVQRKRIAKGR